jgi:hypothetical protein
MTAAGANGRSNSDDSAHPPWAVVLVLLALPVLFNAIALFPELQHSTSYNNDEVFHYLFIERADQAISAGDNPVDHWLPQLELGFPQFLYYQNLPHLVVVGLYRLLLKQVSLIRLLNLVRYLLLVIFPLTVYWSMREMEFSTIAAAVGAAISPMLSSSLQYGFDFNSYVWRGFGMFPQLCAMHLMFIGTACIRRVLEHGQRYVGAIIASSAIVLSDLLYGYIFGIMVVLLWSLSVLKAPGADGLRGFVQRMRRTTARLALVALPVALITAYQTVPFLAQIEYLNLAQPPTPKHRHFGPSGALFGLLQGKLFDDNRLPVITALVIVGIFYCIVKRRDEMKVTLTMLVVWPLLLVPNVIRDALAAVLPLIHLVPFPRLVSGMDFGAILAAGLGGEWIWRWCRFRSPALRIFVPVALLVLFFAPAMIERWNFYGASTDGMEASDEALQEDQDLPQVISFLRKGTPGRVYAGTRGNWGAWMRLGGVHLYDLLPTAQFATVMPWQTLSLNSPLLWELTTPSMQVCRLFNIRYIIAPPTLRTRDWYREVLATSGYNVYEVDSGGYLQLGRVAHIMPMASSGQLFSYNSEWLRGPEPAENKFTAFLEAGEMSDSERANLLDSGGSDEGSKPLGTIEDEAVTPDSFTARVTATSPAILVFKTTYHPNWHVTVDGTEQRTFMVSPSLIATSLRPGHHQVRAEYRSSTLKKMLLVLAGLSLLATGALWFLGYDAPV